MIYTCPCCTKLYEGGSDQHGREPCPPCYKLGWRTDAVGNITAPPGQARRMLDRFTLPKGFY